jgi:hypothetical protein
MVGRERVMVETFKDRDEEYLTWCRRHPDGHVVNTTRTCSPSFMKLHRVRCSHITQLFGRGERLTGDYIKICATERASLDAWAAEHDGELQPCGLCMR